MARNHLGLCALQAFAAAKSAREFHTIHHRFSLKPPRAIHPGMGENSAPRHDTLPMVHLPAFSGSTSALVMTAHVPDLTAAVPVFLISQLQSLCRKLLQL